MVDSDEREVDRENDDPLAPRGVRVKQRRLDAAQRSTIGSSVLDTQPRTRRCIRTGRYDDDFGAMSLERDNGPVD